MALLAQVRYRMGMTVEGPRFNKKDGGDHDEPSIEQLREQRRVLQDLDLLHREYTGGEPYEDARPAISRLNREILAHEERSSVGKLSKGSVFSVSSSLEDVPATVPGFWAPVTKPIKGGVRTTWSGVKSAIGSVGDFAMLTVIYGVTALNKLWNWGKWLKENTFDKLPSSIGGKSGGGGHAKPKAAPKAVASHGGHGGGHH
jgi:hypothetical protein